MSAQHQFPQTRWTLVLSSGEEGSRREALEWLCQHYWQPLYAFLRRRGHEAAEAQDLVQGFLAVFLERRSMEKADPERGRFRSYLLGALVNYLADRHDYQQAVSRGGGKQILALSFDKVEQRYLLTPEHLSPESLYERQWALALVERVVNLMRAEQASAGKGASFELLKPFLTADGDYASVSQSLEMSEGTVRVAVHRMRRRYRELLIAEIGETVRDPGEVRNEIRRLIEIVSSG